MTASCLREMAEKGLVNIAGGCCGTTPVHIAAIREALEGISPREVPGEGDGLVVCGLDAVVVDKEKSNFVNVGERTNVSAMTLI